MGKKLLSNCKVGLVATGCFAMLAIAPAFMFSGCQKQIVVTPIKTAKYIPLEFEAYDISESLVIDAVVHHDEVTISKATFKAIVTKMTELKHQVLILQETIRMYNHGLSEINKQEEM